MSQKKQLKHTRRDCGGTFNVEYTDDNIPYIECEKCGHKIEDWVRWENEYKDLWRNEDKWKSKKDHLSCLLGWFVHLYKEYYRTDFTFSLNERGLFRGSEMYHVRKVLAMFDNSPEKSREYINWIFDNKVRLRKKRITSLGFLATPGVIQEFKLEQERHKIISRSTPLPDKMLEWIDKFTPRVLNFVSLRDFGELNIFLTYYREGYMSDVHDINKFIVKLVQTGYIDLNCKILNWRE